MKNMLIGILIGASLVMVGSIIANRQRGPITSGARVVENPRLTNTILPVQDAQVSENPVPSDAQGSTERTEAAQAQLPQQMEQLNMDASSLRDQLSTYQKTRYQLSAARQEHLLGNIRHQIAESSPALNVTEILRDAEVSTARLLNKHGGQLYKFAGLILETNSTDLTIVMKNTEIVCSFADEEWKTQGLKVGGTLYACGLFESFKDEGLFRQITMAKCYTVENYYSLRKTEPTEAEKQEAINDAAQDRFYLVDFKMRSREQGR